jgi:hypothetical protein
MRVIDFQGIPNLAAADQNATVGSSATLLSALVTLHAQTRFVRVSVDTDDVRFTVSGTTPTATLGRQLTVDSDILLTDSEAAVARFIRVTTDSRIQVSQYKA